MGCLCALISCHDFMSKINFGTTDFAIRVCLQVSWTSTGHMTRHTNHVTTVSEKGGHVLVENAEDPHRSPAIIAPGAREKGMSLIIVA